MDTNVDYSYSIKLEDENSFVDWGIVDSPIGEQISKTSGFLISKIKLKKQVIGSALRDLGIVMLQILNFAIFLKVSAHMYQKMVKLLKSNLEQLRFSPKIGKALVQLPRR